MTMLRCIAELDPETYKLSYLHGQTRDWPETNCYTDVWIELLNAYGFDPAAMLGFTVAQDFEGDHFTFFKPPPEDMASLFGFQVAELAIYDTLEAHILEQMARRQFTLVEVDSFYLPDTRGVSYQIEHTKSTIAINGIDPVTKRLEYFHSASLYELHGDEYDAVMGRLSEQLAGHMLFPYVEFVKRDPAFTGAGFNIGDHLRTEVVNVLRKQLARRPRHNPIAAFGERLAAQIELIAAKPPEYFHRYAFNTLRQAGANFELLSSHLQWLEAQGEEGLQPAIASSKEISSEAKIVQFQLARAVMKRNFSGLQDKLLKMTDAYQTTLDLLSDRYKI